MSVTLRPGRSTDAGKIGAILQEFALGTHWMPVLHNAAEAVAFCGHMLEQGWVRVAEQEARVLGFLALRDHEVLALYLRPEAQGRGIGKLLLDQAKAQRAELRLWTFAANTGAQRFYLREGFVEAGRGDGTNNDEGLPDIAYVWRKGENMT